MSTVKRWGDDLGAWASSVRFSGFTVLIVALIAAGALIISPSLSTYVQQRREIAELRASVTEHQQAVDEVDAERARWKDPAYVRAQARDRLFYVMPGETQLNVIDDIVMPVESTEETSAELSHIDRNWAKSLVSSFLVAGTTDAAPSSDSAAATESAEIPAAEDPEPDITPNEESTP